VKLDYESMSNEAIFLFAMAKEKQRGRI